MTRCRVGAVAAHACYNGLEILLLKYLEICNFAQLLPTRATDVCYAILCDMHFELILITFVFIMFFLHFTADHYLLPKMSLFAEIIFILTSWTLNLVPAYTSTLLLRPLAGAKYCNLFVTMYIMYMYIASSRRQMAGSRPNLHTMVSR